MGRSMPGLPVHHRLPDILERGVKGALESITTSKTRGGDGSPVELFQILKDDAVKVLHSICQQIWKTQQCTGLEKVSFHSNPKESEVTQSCPTLCNTVDCSLPSSSVHGILQARILEWVVFPFSRGSSQPRDQTQASCIAGRFFTSLATRKAQGCRTQNKHEKKKLYFYILLMNT